MRTNPPPRRCLRRGPPSGPKKAKRSIGTSCSGHAGSKCYLVDGWWNALWPGSATPAGWQKTTREALCERRSVGVGCDELPYGWAVGSHLRPFYTVSRASILGNSEAKLPMSLVLRLFVLRCLFRLRHTQPTTSVVQDIRVILCTHLQTPAQAVLE